MTKKPTMKQKQFVDAYIETDYNATEAALQTYNVNNKRDAANIGYQNLQKPHIQELVDSKSKELKNRTADVLKDKDLMGLALETAHDDLMDPEPKVRNEARKFILKVHEYLSETERKKDGTKHAHLHIPKFKG